MIILIKRNSNIELLRIISILLIIGHHFSFYSGIEYQSLSINNFILLFLMFGGKVGANIFMIISGYFSVVGSKSNYKKIFKLWIQVLFYSVGIYLFLSITNIISFNFSDLFKSLFPITFDKYWFASCFIIIMIFSEYLNNFLVKMSKKDYRNFIILCIILWSVLPFITTQKYLSNNLIILTLMYAIGGYIKLHYDSNDNKRLLMYLVSLIFFTYAGTLGLYFLHMNFNFDYHHIFYLYNLNSPFVIGISIIIFILFINNKVFSNSIINMISSTVFGIYLIHDNSFLRNVLWESIINVSKFYNCSFFLLFSIFSILGIFVGCFIIEYLRILIVDRFVNTMISKFLPFFEKMKKNCY